MKSTGHAWSYKAWYSTVISRFSTALIGAFQSFLFHSVVCSLYSPQSHGSPVVVFWSWASTLLEFLFHYPCWCCQDEFLYELPLWTCACSSEGHDKLFFGPEWLVSGVVGMLWNGGGISTGGSDASIMLLNSVLHRPSSLSDVHLAVFTGNLVSYAIFFSRVDSVFWSY